MEKPALYYTVREQTNRLTGQPMYIPAIVERASEPSATVETDSFASKGPNLLSFAYPTSGLTRGKSYWTVVSRSADGERWFTGAGVAVSIEEEA